MCYMKYKIVTMVTDFYKEYVESIFDEDKKWSMMLSITNHSFIFRFINTYILRIDPIKSRQEFMNTQQSCCLEKS